MSLPEKETNETPEDLKDQANDGELKKGYNEKNPSQEEGAFTTDGNDENSSDEAPKAPIK